MLPNYNGSTFLVAIDKILPFCEYTVAENKQTHTEEVLHTQNSFELKILETLAEKMRFKTKFIIGSHDRVVHAWSYNKKAADNSTTKNLRSHAFVQAVSNRTADIALCDISITEERFAVVDYTVPTYHNEIGFISYSPSVSSSSVNLIVSQPFTGEVWLAMVITFVTLLLALKILSFFKGNGLQLYDLTIGFLAIALKQHSKLTKNLISSKTIGLLLSLWILACLVLSNLYSSVFYSLLTIPHEQLIDTIQDILRVAQTDSHFIYVRNNSIFQSRFLNASPNERLFYAIGQHLRRNKKVITRYDLKFVEEHPKSLLITSRMFLTVQRMLYGTERLHVGRDSLGPDLSGIILPKGSPLKEPFDRVILQCQEFGFVNYWVQKTILLFAKRKKKKNVWKNLENSYLKNSFKKLHQNHKGSSKEFKLADVQSIFIIFLLGLSASMFAFIVELVVAC